MRTWLRNREVAFSDVLDAFCLWSRSKSGRKNMRVVTDQYGDGGALCAEVLREIKSRTLSFRPIRYYDRVEPTNGKVRTIGVQSVKQQVCDYIVISMLQPMLDARIGFYQCASIPGKGQVLAMRHLREWYDEGGWFVKLDVRQCYPSVDQSVLMGFLRKHVGSADLIYICEAILGSYGSGLNIGSYFSQYMANLLLSTAYHHVEFLHKVRRGKRKALVAHQLWYMDDCVLFSRDKRDLTMAARELERFISEDLHMSVKPWKVCRCGRDQLDMVGYVMRTGTVRLRKSTWKRARRAFIRQSRAPCLARAYRVVSYWGFLKWTDGAWNRRMKRVFDAARRAVAADARSRYEGEPLQSTR